MRDFQQLLNQARHQIHVGLHPVAVSFRVLVILTSSPKHPSPEQAAPISQEDFGDADAPDITCVDLRDRYELSPMAAFEPLRSAILDKLLSVRKEQAQCGALFSAHHLGALWKANLEFAMRNRDSTAFDCLRVARRGFPPTSRRVACLVDFLRQANEAHCEAEDVYSFIASALLMDAYLPGMHCEPTHF
jgi:hypothetical protein